MQRALFGILLALTLSLPQAAGAQAPELAAVREALASYDLSGDRTIGALRDLARLSRELEGGAQTEARFLRAAVALDLAIAGAVDPARAALSQRACDAIGLSPCEGLADHLSNELGALARGAYRAAAIEAIAAIGLMRALARGELSAIRDGSGVRRDVLLVAAGGREAGLAAIARDRCAARCEQPWPSIDLDTRRRLDALLEVSAAMARIARAASGGDALAQALGPVLAPIEAGLESGWLRAAPIVPEAFGIDAAAPSGDPVRADLIVIVGATEVRIARVPRFRVQSGTLIAESGEDVLPSSAAIPLPGELRPVITAIDEVSAAIAAREGATIAIAPRAEAPAHVIARVLASAQRAGRSPGLLARRAPDGTLRAVPIALADRDEVGAAGDVVVRVRMGGYGVARGRGREQSVPRVRGSDGTLGFDLEGLQTMLDRIPRRRTVLDAMPSLLAHDLLDAAFRIAGPESPVTFAL